MKARPIMFSGPMVRALLEGRKTQTRRIVKNPMQTAMVRHHPHYERDGGALWLHQCPYGRPGDLLWVREAWRTYAALDKEAPRSLIAGTGLVYEAGGRNFPQERDLQGMGKKVRPGMFMPRWASRLTLRLTDVRVQRLQEISKDDAIAEGAKQWDVLEGTSARLPRWSMEPQTSEQCCMHGPQMAFANYINKLHGGENWNLKPSNLWAENPWAWALTFEILRENVDSVIEPAKAVA